MEGMNMYSICILSDDSHKTFTHVMCCLISEGKTENIRWGRISKAENICHSKREEFCFSTSGSCYNEDWTIDGVDSLFLFGIERCISCEKSIHVVQLLNHFCTLPEFTLCILFFDPDIEWISSFCYTEFRNLGIEKCLKRGCGRRDRTDSTEKKFHFL